MKKTNANYISQVHKLTFDQKEQIRTVFEDMDKDGNGCIDFEEMKECMKKLGMELTEKEAKEIMDDIDMNGDGKITLQEFMEAMADWLVD